jgi:hypothetical protein
MTRVCTVCRSEFRAEIERELAAGESYRDIARHFGLGKDSIARHYADHLPAVPVAPVAVASAVATPDPTPVPDVERHDARLLGRLGLACACGADNWEEFAGLYHCCQCQTPIPAAPTCPHYKPSRGGFYPIQCEQCGHAWKLDPPLVAPLRDPVLSDRCPHCFQYASWTKDYRTGRWLHACGGIWNGTRA